MHRLTIPALHAMHSTGLDSSAMDLFRTLYPRQELSPRALALTTHLVSQNPSTYSIWAYRASILIDGPEQAAEATSAPQQSSSQSAEPTLGRKDARLQRELEWMEEVSSSNLKSYQVWQHRRLILAARLALPMTGEKNGAGVEGPAQLISNELQFIASVLDKDSKNYHTWAYRQWVLAEYAGMELPGSPARSEAMAALWQGELPYVNRLLAEDVRNNSAWNHRFFVLFGSGRAAGRGAEKVGLASGGSAVTASPVAEAGGDRTRNLVQCIEAEVR